MSVDKVIQLALAEVGVREIPKGANRGPRVDVFTGGRVESWCAHFVAWVFRQAGMAIPKDVEPTPKRVNMLASVKFMENVFRELGWLVKEPTPGDIVFYKGRGKSDRGPGRHVGIVVKVEADKIQTVEGNWGDRVALRNVKKTDPLIASYGRYGGG